MASGSGLALLQAIGDVANFPTDIEDFADQDKFDPVEDPVVQAILDDPTIDSSTKSFLRESDRNRVQTDRLEFQLQRQISKLNKEQSQPSIFSTIGGVPVGFQLGTASRIQNPVARFAADLILDPLNLVSGVGGITKLGRASKFLTSGAKLLTPAQKAKRIVEGANFLGHVAASTGRQAKAQGPALAQAIKQAFQAGDERQILKLFGQFSKSKLKPAELRRLKKFDDDLFDIISNPREAQRNLKAFFSLRDSGQVRKFEKGLLKQFVTGQRSALQFGLPFSTADLGSTNLGIGKLIKGFGSGDVFESTKKAVKAVKEDAIGTPLVQATGDLIDELPKAERASAIIRRNEATFNTVGDLLSGRELRKFTGTNQLYASGLNIGPTTKTLLNGIDNAAREVTVQGRLSIPERTLREELTLAGRSGKAFDEVFAKLSSEGQDYVTRAAQMLDDVGAIAKEEEVIQDLLDDYLPRVLEFKKKGGRKELQNISKSVKQSLQGSSKGGFGRTRPRGKHGLRRYFETIQATAKWAERNSQFGIEVKMDFVDGLESYLRSTGNATIRNQYLRFAQNSRTIDGNLPLIIHANDISGTSKAAKTFRKNAQFYTQGKDLPKMTQAFDKFYIHEDAVGPLNTLWGTGWRSLSQPTSITDHIVRAADKFNSLVKGTIFTFSPFFHGWALTYSNLATLPLAQSIPLSAEVLGTTSRFAVRNFKNAMTGRADLVQQDLVETMFKGWSRAAARSTVGGAKILGNKADDIISEMVQTSGMKFARPTQDTGFLQLTEALRSISSTIDFPLVKHAIDGVDHLNDLTDKALWSVMFDQYRANAWVLLRDAAIRRDPSILNDANKVLKLNKSMGDFVGRAYGGILDQILASKEARAGLRNVMLAPDWTIANLMVARDAFLNFPGVRDVAPFRLLTRDIIMKDVRFRYAMGYNMRAAAYVGIFGNALNYMFTSIKDGKGRFLWESDKDANDKLTGIPRIELPYNRSDGRKQYMDISKQFSEPLKFMLSPFEEFKRKLAPLPRITKTVVLGEDAFGNPIYGAEDGPMRQVVSAIAESSAQMFPIPASAAFQGLTTERSLISGLASSMIGFGISSESRQHFEARRKIAEIQAQLLQGTR